MYPVFVTLYVQYTKNRAIKKLSFIWTYMCRVLRIHNNLSLFPLIPSYADLKCSVHQKKHFEYGRTRGLTRNQPSKSGFLLTLYVHVCLTVNKWLPFDLICWVTLEYIVTTNSSVHEKPSHQKMASVWAYIFSIHCNLTQLPCSNLLQIMNWPYVVSIPRN